MVDLFHVLAISVFTDCATFGGGTANLCSNQDTGWTAWVRIQAMARNFSRLQNVQTRTGAHLIPYAIGTRGFFFRGKAAAA